MEGRGLACLLDAHLLHMSQCRGALAAVTLTPLFRACDEQACQLRCLRVTPAHVGLQAARTDHMHISGILRMVWRSKPERKERQWPQEVISAICQYAKPAVPEATRTAVLGYLREQVFTHQNRSPSVHNLYVALLALSSCSRDLHRCATESDASKAPSHETSIACRGELEASEYLCCSSRMLPCIVATTCILRQLCNDPRMLHAFIPEFSYFKVRVVPCGQLEVVEHERCSASLFSRSVARCCIVGMRQQ
jgi:hypothetical protein